jgi:hypothetical protein
MLPKIRQRTATITGQYVPPSAAVCASAATSFKPMTGSAIAGMRIS